MKQYHIPVLLTEVIEALQVRPGGRYIDCTVGEGGHSAAILEKSTPGGQLLGLDADPEAIKLARARLQPYDGRVLLLNENFTHLEEICSQYNFHPVNGILFDLGISSLQLEGESRGFSFQRDTPLDMRFDPHQELTAADIVNNFPEDELARIIKEYGEERKARQIARSIIKNRPIRSARQLAQIVAQSLNRRGKIHPATKTFQALRIATNRELDNLRLALEQAVKLLEPGGRLVIISFHSLEDRLVKNFLKQEAKGCICPPEIPECICGHVPTLKLLSNRVIKPTLAEVHHNPRSRSAKMRVAERI